MDGHTPAYSPEALVGGSVLQTKERGERREEASPWASLWGCELFLAGGWLALRLRASRAGRRLPAGAEWRTIPR